MNPDALQLAVNFSLKDIVLFIFYVAVGIYALFSAVLFFHWQTYSIDSKVSGLTLLIYFAASIPLILIMAAMLLII